MARLKKFRLALSPMVQDQFTRGKAPADIIRALRDEADTLAEQYGLPTDIDKDQALRNAANQFAFYAGQHDAKEPPQTEKAEVNRQYRDQMLRAAGIAAATDEIAPVPKNEDDLFLPVEVAEVTGNIPESELLARYLEGKVSAARNHIAHRPHLTDSLEQVIRVLETTAEEIRDGLHIPPVIIEGKVIPYNEDRDSGQRHADAIRQFFTDVYGRNLKAGWWTDIETGLPKKRSVGELFMLFVTEIAEAYEAYTQDAADDKLTQYPGLGVELADLGIRWADFCGALLAGNIVYHSDVPNPGDKMFQEVCMIARHYEAIRKTPEANGEPEEGDFLPVADVATMVDAKLEFNAHRADHKIENRLKEGGKRT